MDIKERRNTPASPYFCSKNFNQFYPIKKNDKNNNQFIEEEIFEGINISMICKLNYKLSIALLLNN